MAHQMQTMGFPYTCNVTSPLDPTADTDTGSSADEEPNAWGKCSTPTLYQFLKNLHCNELTQWKLSPYVVFNSELFE